MNTEVECGEVTATFWLPDWFPPDRKDYTKVFKYSPRHIWAGQVERTEQHNKSADNLWRLKGAKEVCHIPGHSYIKFELDPDKDIQKQIDVLKGKLERMLAQYREAV